MATKTNLVFNILWQLPFMFMLLSCHHDMNLAYAAGGGKWDLLMSNIGISAMHMQLLNNDRVVMYDRTDFGASNISLPDGKCRNNPNDLALKVDCTAHSVEYDVSTNSIRPLMVQTDVWCSSGSATSDGTLVQTGGFNDGKVMVRNFKPCATCDWQELGNGLIQSRWYSANHLLPDGRQIIVGGRDAFNYEFYPKTASTNNVFSLPFLQQTNVPREENNLYPFVFLNVDGNLFIFANDRAILLDYTTNTVVKTYPQIPGGNPRNYPSTGSAVLLPLKNLRSEKVEAEVLVCGGAPKGSYPRAAKGDFVGALNTCGRITITDPNPQWTMETMPLPRTMGDMVILPDGNVLIINGAASGTAGWQIARNPVLSPVIYRPDNPSGSRFEVQNPNTTPRMYHSTAVLLRDGRVLVGGSNPNELYNFTGVLFPTDLSLEAFSPSYLDSQSTNLRPQIISPDSHLKYAYGQRVDIQFTSSGLLNRDLIKVTMIAPGFNTHSNTMNQRMLVLPRGIVRQVGKSVYEVSCAFPKSGKLAPPGYYLLFVVHQDIPSEGIWVRVN
ncbi:aldehyde oxidase GLOX-like [Capsicum annuum]|uniref:aldehyde oxidase GLOX-like n=1 Tax=Capsicum annuum TaxID=4072 RepID=UPI0007BFA72F|nr:aldehyde oxidase GLOX-like [Capsicum annuum]